MATKKEISFASFEEIYEVDEEKSTEGIWHEWGFNKLKKPMRLLIAEAGNPTHQKARRKYEKALENSRRNRNKFEFIMAKVVAEGVLLGWEGILDSKDKEAPPTLENRVAALSQYDRLFIDVLEVANNPENYRSEDPEAVEDSEGNSEKTSDG